MCLKVGINTIFNLTRKIVYCIDTECNEGSVHGAVVPAAVCDFWLRHILNASGNTEMLSQYPIFVIFG